MTKLGKVYLVGAGPGDPALITVKGQACLAEADLVLYDGLVNPLLLRHTHAEAVRTCRSAAGDDGRRRLNQAEINSQLIEAAREGLTVVRLKSGDPYIFGRGGEEATALAEAGIPFEVVPGITAATSVGAYAGISLTHRNFASAVAFVTGHEDPTKQQQPLDYRALAQFPGTLVFYMGMHHLKEITRELLSAGKPSDTPAADTKRSLLDPGRDWLGSRCGGTASPITDRHWRSVVPRASDGLVPQPAVARPANRHHATGTPVGFGNRTLSRAGGRTDRSAAD